MVMTKSQMLPLGTQAPSFELPDPDGKLHTLPGKGEAKATLVVFMCNHCPYVRHLRSALADLGRQLQEQGVAMFGINSNDWDSYPDDSPDRMKDEAKTWGYGFPYLLDETQEVAKAYRAACTPDFYLFDADLKLVYRGQFDDSRPSDETEPTGEDLRAAIDAVVAGREVPGGQKASVGCNIKWKAGNEPEWFG